MTAPLDLDALERMAREATPGPWCRFYRNDVICVMKGVRPRSEGNTEVVKWSGFDGGFFSVKQNARNAAHVAAFNPVTVLALIARLRAAEAREREAVAETEELAIASERLIQAGNAAKAALVECQDQLDAERKRVRTLTPPEGSAG